MEATSHSHPRETVVVVHGLAGNRWVMNPLCRRLQAKGYATVNWRYWSLVGGVEKHAQRLAEQLAALEHDSAVDTIHLVGHSLGCILIRIALEQQRPAKLGRVVMLAPPNRGSPVASAMRGYLGWLLPVVPQLSDRAESLVNALPRKLSPVEVGVLAADTDILVPWENTQLEQQCDHRTLACRHLTILFRPEAAELVDCFLREGTFGEAPS